LLRNAAVALGNSANRDAVPILARVLASEPEPMVRSHAAWALGALGGVNAKSALEQHRNGEADHGVRAEIAAALAAV
jgi:epoxyqueuosine reductase